MARSSRPRPFSTILREVTASFAAQPILAKRCNTHRIWMSGEDVNRGSGREISSYLRLSLHIFHIVLYTDEILKSSSTGS